MAETETMDAATEAAMAEFGLRPEPSIVPDRLMPPAFLTHRGEVAKPYSPTLQDRFGKALRDLGLARSTVNGLVGSTGLGREGPMAGNSMSDFSPLGLLWAGDVGARDRFRSDIARASDARAQADADFSARVPAVAQTLAGYAVDAAGVPQRAFEGSQRLSGTFPEGVTVYDDGRVVMPDGTPYDPAADIGALLDAGGLAALGNVPRAVSAMRGGVDPSTVSALGAAPAKAAVREGAEAVARVANPIRAYHGSPHSFDKFDSSKIGTGEGAQAYGHGLYFAESEGVAGSYRDKLAAGMSTDRLRETGVLSDSDLRSMRQFTQSTAVPEIAFRDWMHWIGKSDDTGKLQAAFMQAWNERNPGSMYEVAIHANPDDFLDWDAPISQSAPPHIQEAVSNSNWGYRSATLPASKIGPIDEVAARELRDAGIPGIKFRDAMSRGPDGGRGTRNYVVFPGNEHLIEVLRKYGIVGLLGTGAAAALADGGSGKAQAATMPAYQTGGGF